MVTRVLLIHCRTIQHYRIPIYEWLGNYLKSSGYELMVISDAIESQATHLLGFQYKQMSLSTFKIAQFVYKMDIDVIIMFVDMRHLYLFPTYVIVKALLQRKIIYWGQGCDLVDRKSRIKNMAYKCELALCDAIILYAEHLRKYVPRRFHKKIWIANNTLYLNYSGIPSGLRETILKKYNIHTRKNIICVGRIQRRKRLHDLVAAHALLNRCDIGLILAGPDPDDLLHDANGKNIYKVGPIYGTEKYDLISAADVFCLPGAVGLGIVDAFHCGLPLVTEDGDESAEIMYLRDGENGFVVPRHSISEMAQKLLLLLDNDTLRQRFSNAARREIAENGHIDKMCAGFRDALFYVTRRGTDCGMQ